MSATLPLSDINALSRNAEFEILTPEAEDFLRALDERFDTRRIDLLEARKNRQRQFDEGNRPRFLEETRPIREARWNVAPIPPDLLDRRVEITGPTDRKMIINALNSGANVFMADFEDSNAPTWSNCIEGQLNLRDANLRTIEYRSPEGKLYKLGPNPAVLFVRPRGWHMVEKHFPIHCFPISASLFDFGLYFFHNYRTLVERGTAPYFYLPKLESHQEARLWNDVFLFAQEYVGLPKGTIRATVLIETISAAFEMDEILYELRDHSAGLNCGRWDYIFSFIKKFRNHPEFMLPERGVVTMEQPFLRSYVELLIHTCHKRGIHAMGGMAAQIPIRNNPAANDEAMERVRQDKLREVRAGHDGTWVAHPGLVPRRQSCIRRTYETAQPDPTAGCVHVENYRAESSRGPARPANRSGLCAQYRRCAALYRVVAARQRMRPHLQPHGRRSNRGNFTRPTLAVDTLRGSPRRRPNHYAGDDVLFALGDILDGIKTELGGSKFAIRSLSALLNC